MAETRLITLRRPDDWHVHLRDGDVLAAVAPLTAPRFARAVVMPNLVPPVATTRHGMPARRTLPGATQPPPRAPAPDRRRASHGNNVSRFRGSGILWSARNRSRRRAHNALFQRRRSKCA